MESKIKIDYIKNRDQYGIAFYESDPYQFAIVGCGSIKFEIIDYIERDIEVRLSNFFLNSIKFYFRQNSNESEILTDLLNSMPLGDYYIIGVVKEEKHLTIRLEMK